MVKQLAARQRGLKFYRGDSAQSLIEVAIMMPIFVLLFCYAVDFGYFFIVSASVTSSARNAVAYSVQGSSSAASAPLPPLGSAPLPPAGDISVSTSVAALAIADLSGFLNSSTTTSVSVCSAWIGTNSNHTSMCASYGSASSSYTADVDPESSMFQLNRVDVTYTVTPPIPISFMPAGVAPASMSFHRMAEMREIN